MRYQSIPVRAGQPDDPDPRLNPELVRRDSLLVTPVALPGTDEAPGTLVLALEGPPGGTAQVELWSVSEAPAEPFGPDPARTYYRAGLAQTVQVGVLGFALAVLGECYYRLRSVAVGGASRLLVGHQGQQGALAAWPIDSVYIGAAAINPALLFGFGVWVAFATGRVLVGQDVAQTEFDTLGETGGEKTHVLSLGEMPAHSHVQDAHNHTQNAHGHVQDAHTHTQDAHNHTQDAHAHVQQAQGATIPLTTGTHVLTSTTTGGSLRDTETTEPATATNQAATATNQAATATNQTSIATNQATTATSQSTGGGGAHNNLPPYLVVAMWRRVG